MKMYQAIDNKLQTKYIHKKKFSPMIVKLLKTKYKKKNLWSSWRKQTYYLQMTNNRTDLLFNRNNGNQKTVEYLQSASECLFQYLYPVKTAFKNESKMNIFSKYYSIGNRLNREGKWSWMETSRCWKKGRMGKVNMWVTKGSSSL